MEIKPPSLFPIEEETDVEHNHTHSPSMSQSQSFDSLDIMQLKSELVELEHWKTDIGLPSLENEKKSLELNEQLQGSNEDLKLQIESYRCEIASHKMTIKTYEDENRKWLSEKEEMQSKMQYLTQKSANEMKHLTVLSVHNLSANDRDERNEMIATLQCSNQTMKLSLQTLKTQLSKLENDLFETEKQNIKYQKSFDEMHLKEEHCNNRITELISELIENKNELEISERKCISMSTERREIMTTNMQLHKKLGEISEIRKMNDDSLKHHRRLSSHTVKVRSSHPTHGDSQGQFAADLLDHVIGHYPSNCHSRNLSLASSVCSHRSSAKFGQNNQNRAVLIDFQSCDFGLNPALNEMDSHSRCPSPTLSLQTVRENGLRQSGSDREEESEYTVDDDDDAMVNANGPLDLDVRMRQEMEAIKENVELHYSKLMRKQKADLVYEYRENEMGMMLEIEQLKNEVMRLRKNRKSNKKYKKMQKLEKKMMKHAKINDAKMSKCDFWKYPWCYSVAK